MPDERSARTVHGSRRHRSSSDARRRKTSVNVRRMIVVYGFLAWIAGGIALEFPSTSHCFEEFAEFGVMAVAGNCLPLASLGMFLWMMAGAVVLLVVYYWLRTES
jgi:hypothetical protein